MTLIESRHLYIILRLIEVILFVNHGFDVYLYLLNGEVGRAVYVFLFFFFKQKTAYEISECDWSSDVCSSDLFFFFKQKTAYEISECDWSSDVCSSDLIYQYGRESGPGHSNRPI